MKSFRILLISLFFLNSLGAKEICSEKKILICGVCKNVRKGFKVVFNSVNQLASNFADYRLVVYENNSKDQTKELYKSWTIIDPKVVFLSEDLTEQFLQNYIPKTEDYRIGYISRARNIVLKEINKKCYDDFDYVIMVDLDQFYPWDIENIIKTIEDPEQEWDAVFANGLYDILAFRTEDCFIGPELIGPQSWFRNCVPIYSEKLKNWISIGKWIPVKSAFGGLAIYKKNSIKNCRYKAMIDQELYETHIKNVELDRDCAYRLRSSILLQPIINSYKFYMRWEKEQFNKNSKILKTNFIPRIYICEHINFHSDMIKNGHDKLFINPKLIMMQK